MTAVAITQNRDDIGEAIWEAERLGLGETDTDRMEFPAMSLKEAIHAFTEAAYGKRLTFESE
jgi:hypothetical protein